MFGLGIMEIAEPPATCLRPLNAIVRAPYSNAIFPQFPVIGSRGDQLVLKTFQINIVSHMQADFNQPRFITLVHYE